MPVKGSSSRRFKEPAKISQWGATLMANLEKATGKTMTEWVKIARKCPHEKVRDRLKWLKDEHGVGQNRGVAILEAAFGGTALGETDPEELVTQLFRGSFADQRKIYEKVADFAEGLGEVVVSPRKGYVAFYRLKQFAAIRPSKDGLLVGLALRTYPRNALLGEIKNLGGGDRVKKALTLKDAKGLSAEAKALIKSAWAEN